MEGEPRGLLKEAGVPDLVNEKMGPFGGVGRKLGDGQTTGGASTGEMTQHERRERMAAAAHRRNASLPVPQVTVAEDCIYRTLDSTGLSSKNSTPPPSDHFSQTPPTLFSFSDEDDGDSSCWKKIGHTIYEEDVGRTAVVETSVSFQGVDILTTRVQRKSTNPFDIFEFASASSDPQMNPTTWESVYGGENADVEVDARSSNQNETQPRDPL
ncbi:hypothetical protein H0H87_005795 [Tephrocybe sp. NHM501043]|nr:hypothetical protein H0H87_005795 [Tephrocybe sp. NHM501043]